MRRSQKILFGDYEKIFFAGSLLSHSRQEHIHDEEMHCCENCKRYEYNEGSCKGCTEDPADDNKCRMFVADWVLE